MSKRKLTQYEGIHTCSKGCKKTGCNRTLRDTIEEQDAQIEALKAEVDELKSQPDPLTAYLYAAELAKDDIKKLKAEVERLRITEQNQIERVISLEDCIQVLKQDRDGLLYEESEQVARLKAEVERLTKAGDAMASSIQFNEEMAKDYNGTTIVHQSVQRWNASKEGKQSQ